MTPAELLKKLSSSTTSNAVADVLNQFATAYPSTVRWVPLGRDNNRGTVEGAANPGRSLVERVTNAIDAVLELEHHVHSGHPECRSPREAAEAWLQVPREGLYKLSQAARQKLAERVVLTIHEGDTPKRRTVDIRDYGIGIPKDRITGTILSLNESNKLNKFYLAGAYGQGGSSTFAVCTYSLIVSRPAIGGGDSVAFSVVKYEDLPADVYKHGRYVYLTLGGQLLEAQVSAQEFPPGTLVRHYAYDFSPYPSPFGPNSVYGLLQEALFDPVMPLWLEDEPHNNRRSIQGSRNGLNGALEDGPKAKKTEVAHPVPLYFVQLGEYGSLGIEYWVLKSEGPGKRPNASFVNPLKPIILTHHGQSHGDLPGTVIRKQAELPYLGSRMVVHLDCNSLTPLAKRNLFVSNREEVRSGEVLRAIKDELIRALKADEDLARLNIEAEQEGLKERDEEAEQKIRTEVARLLRTMGFQSMEPLGGAGQNAAGAQPARPARPRPPKPPLEPIPIVEPPTMLEFAGEGPIKFYPTQRRYVRVRTNAAASYHSPNDPTRSRFNLIVSAGLTLCGSTSLTNGRMRFIVQAAADAPIGSTGTISLELIRPGLEALRASVPFEIIVMPEPAPTGNQIALPPFEVRAVAGPDDPKWADLNWPADINTVASSAEMSGGRLVIHYSEQFPAFRQAKARFDQRGLAQAKTFVSRYEIWVAMHSLLMQDDERRQEQAAEVEAAAQQQELDERQERCRLATLAAMFAGQEAQQSLEQAAAATAAGE